MLDDSSMMRGSDIAEVPDSDDPIDFERNISKHKYVAIYFCAQPFLFPESDAASRYSLHMQRTVLGDFVPQFELWNNLTRDCASGIILEAEPPGSAFQGWSPGTSKGLEPWNE